MPKTETTLAKVEPFEPLAMLGEAADDLTASFRENVGEITLFDLDKLQVPSGGATTWQIETLGGVESVQKLRGVILHQQQARQFYLQAGTPDGSPPDCASADGKIGLGDRGLSDDEGEHDCFTCPHAQWGTSPGKDGKASRGQACGQRAHVLVLHEFGGTIPVFLSLPPTGIKGLRKYLLRLSGSGKRYYQVVTELGLERASNQDGLAYSKAMFAYGGDLEPREAATALTLRNALLKVIERGVPTVSQASPDDLCVDPNADFDPDPPE